MFEVLLESLHQKVTLTPDQEKLCKNFFKHKTLRKRQFLLQQDEQCHYLAFVESGVLRSYFSNEKGYEHILQFAFSGWWISDMNSLMTGQPSMLNIEALEDSELLLLTKDNYDQLLKEVPAMERYFRLLTLNAMIALQRRLIASMSQNAEEKYTNLLQTFPLIFQNVPQHMIASYLGITAETLSRIRKQIATRK